ncbi:MAG: M14 family metallopeptidase [Pseudomonadales bacterium]
MVSISNCFSLSYQESREKFLTAARDAGAEITSIAHPEKGPEGEDLFMDIACVGNVDSKVVVIVVAGTHGIEGFCGAGIQINFLRNSEVLQRLQDVKLVLIHGHNPHGFAWLRRVNENNVDLNRNYVDFAESQDMNEAYLGVKDLILPEHYGEESEKALAEWTEENGLDQFQKIVMGGQRVDPNGLFFGGTSEAWSNKTMREILPNLVANQEIVGLMDVHTGLGPYGHGDLIHSYPKGSDEYTALRDWYGDEMIGINAGEYGDVVAAVPRGPIVSSLDLLLPDKKSIAFVIEYGTVEFERVLKALRADNWLHIHGDVNSQRGKEIKDEMRACFYCESDEWRKKIWNRGLWSVEKLAEGLVKSLSPAVSP